MKTTGVRDIPKFGLLFFLGHPTAGWQGDIPASYSHRQRNRSTGIERSNVPDDTYVNHIVCV